MPYSAACAVTGFTDGRCDSCLAMEARRWCVVNGAGKGGDTVASKYDLIGNVVHDGQPNAGTYRVHIHRRSEDAWYEVQDLRITDILPQMVALSETYMQVYERKA